MDAGESGSDRSAPLRLEAVFVTILSWLRSNVFVECPWPNEYDIRLRSGRWRVRVPSETSFVDSFFQAEDDRRILARLAVNRCTWYPFHQTEVKRNHWLSRGNGCINTVAMRNCSREPFVDESVCSTCRRTASSIQRFDHFCYLHVSDVVCGRCIVLAAHHSFLSPVAFIGIKTKAAVTIVCTF